MVLKEFATDSEIEIYLYIKNYVLNKARFDFQIKC